MKNTTTTTTKRPSSSRCFSFSFLLQQHHNVYLMILLIQLFLLLLSDFHNDSSGPSSSSSIFFGVHALDGQSQSQIRTRNGWKAIEVITEGESKSQHNNNNWIMPGRFDGIGAFVVTTGGPQTSNNNNNDIVRIHVNHELDTNASISEINLYKPQLQHAINQMIRHDNLRNVPEFVRDARLAYFRWTDDGGSTYKTGSDVEPNNAGFCKFCSGQSYQPDTFGPNRGFVDQIYITGEECFTRPGALFALDSHRRTLYKLSGYTGNSGSNSERGGIPYDQWENAALLDTGETNHIALLLSPDADHKSTTYLQLYIGQKGKDPTGNSDSTDFLSRNGLAYGEYYFLESSWPRTGNTNRDGKLIQQGPTSGILGNLKMEDIDTNPNNPTQVVLAESDTGLFVFDFDFRFNSGGNFDSSQTRFTVKKIDTGDIPYADNVDWSRNGMIYINEDSDGGSIWYQTPEGRQRTEIGETRTIGESAGIFDLSEFVDFPHGQIMITSSMEHPASLTILISPDARPVSIPSDGDDNSDNNDNNEGGHILPPPISGFDGDNHIIYYEAEDAQTMYRADIETLIGEYTGNGYANMQGRGSYLEWSLDPNIVVGGTYELYLSYSSRNDRPVFLYVDGSLVGAYDCEGTSNSGRDWSMERKEIVLSGDRTHTIKIMAVPSDGPNIDWLALRSSVLSNLPVELEASGEPMLYQAEVGDCGYCRIDNYRAGFSGSGYVDFRGENGWVSWPDIPFANAGTYQITIRYATPSTRGAELFLNGARIVELDFEGTGGWKQWEDETHRIDISQRGLYEIKIDVGNISEGPNIDFIEIQYMDTRRRRAQQHRGRRIITREVTIPAAAEEESTAMP